MLLQGVALWSFDWLLTVVTVYLSCGVSLVDLASGVSVVYRLKQLDADNERMKDWTGSRRIIRGANPPNMPLWEWSDLERLEVCNVIVKFISLREWLFSFTIAHFLFDYYGLAI